MLEDPVDRIEAEPSHEIRFGGGTAIDRYDLEFVLDRACAEPGVGFVTQGVASVVRDVKIQVAIGVDVALRQ